MQQLSKHNEVIAAAAEMKIDLAEMRRIAAEQKAKNDVLV